MRNCLLTLGCLLSSNVVFSQDGEREPLGLRWKDNNLTISGEQIPGKKLDIWYLEAYCRPGSTDREWGETVIGHETTLVSTNDKGTELHLRCRLRDGVVVDHVIRSTGDEVDFQIKAHNPTEKESLAQWVQPCMRVGRFTGTDSPAEKYDYIERSFVFVDGKLETMPTRDWAKKARYVPGQVWAAPGVDRNDINPRPLNPHTPSNGLIGCFSSDDSIILAMAFEPYQELFQGVIRCLHSDFRLGGLRPGERKKVRGKVYIVPNDVPALLERYERDFPEHVEAVDYSHSLTAIREGWDGKKCWVHSRAGAIPPRSPGNSGDLPAVVLTTQKHLVRGNDIFDGLFEMRTDDLGVSWTQPQAQSGLTRRTHVDKPGEKVESAPCDFTPKWHAVSGKLLGTGKTFWYKNNVQFHDSPSDTIYAVYDAEMRRWNPWRRLDLPDLPKFKNASSGCSQRYDLPNGDVLVPIYFRPNAAAENHLVTVALCSFDGTTLKYIRHGDEIAIPKGESGYGLAEPSLTKFGDRFYLTLRSLHRGYVTTSRDGLEYDTPKRWTFDDGSELGSYNTQQHWVTHDRGLFLVYTRRGANNDHIFRHRAPLFMARVDTERLVVLRSTERIIIPETGTRMGNFGIVDVSPLETWIVTTEWMQQPPPGGFEKYGSNNRIFVARIHWNRLNGLVPI